MKILRIVCGLYLLLTGLLVICQPATVLAQDEGGEKIELKTTYPKLENTAEMASSFEVRLTYHGSETRYFDFKVTGPKGWSCYVAAAYPAGTRIRGMMLEPGKTYGETVNVNVTPPYWPLAEPGEYKIIFEVGSGEISDSIELTRVVTPGYKLSLTPTTEGTLGKYSLSATAGRDNSLSVVVLNEGTTAIDNIGLSSPQKPQGWAVDFAPDKIDSLPAGKYQIIDVNIKPPAKTIAGDYFPIRLMTSGDQATETIDIRVTVETPTLWGWVGVAIIVLVIAGLAVVFMRFSRR